MRLPTAPFLPPSQSVHPSSFSFYDAVAGVREKHCGSDEVAKARKGNYDKVPGSFGVDKLGWEATIRKQSLGKRQ